jgi:hypothetical protein
MSSPAPKYQLEDRVQYIGEDGLGTIASIEVDDYGTAWYGVRWDYDDPQAELFTDCHEKYLELA